MISLLLKSKQGLKASATCSLQKPHCQPRGLNKAQTGLCRKSSTQTFNGTSLKLKEQPESQLVSCSRPQQRSFVEVTA